MKQGQGWTRIVLENLPMTVRDLNRVPRIVDMNVEHRRQRTLAGRTLPAMNSMVYDTLKRLERQGLVERLSDGTYYRTRRCEEHMNRVYGRGGA